MVGRQVRSRAGGNGLGRFVRGRPKRLASSFKAEPGGEIVAHGGARFVQSLTRLGLVDEYRLYLHPVATGGGTPLLTDVGHPREFLLTRLLALDSDRERDGRLRRVVRSRPDCRRRLRGRLPPSTRVVGTRPCHRGSEGAHRNRLQLAWSSSDHGPNHGRQQAVSVRDGTLRYATRANVPPPMGRPASWNRGR
jgi:hypothetical protein